MQRLELLDALRGIAALFVLGYHLHTVFGGFDLFALGYFSVDFFFMLSGYVMARTYEPRFGAGLTAPSFFAARFKRLWPTMAVGTSIGLFVFLSLGASLSDALPLFLATLAFVPHAGAEPFAINRPAWSIFFELVANALHAILLWRLPVRWLTVLAVLAMLAMLPYWSVGSFNLGNKANDFIGGFPRVIFAYAVGIMVCRLNLPIPSLPRNVAPLATWIGALSFPLYAVHYPILQFARGFDLGPFIGFALAVSAAAIVTLAFDQSWRFTARRASA